MDVIKNHKCLIFTTCKFCEERMPTNILPRHENVCYLNPNNIKYCLVCKKPIKKYKFASTCSKDCMLKINKCKYCGKFTTSISSMAYHESTCSLNPNINHCSKCGKVLRSEKQTTCTNCIKKMKDKLNKDKECKYCGFKISYKSKKSIDAHENKCDRNPKNIIKCVICGNGVFDKVLRRRKDKVCSSGCFCKLDKNGGGYISSNHIVICFYFHKKECIICGEKNIVEVHHFDGDHKNNDPKNLVPLCANHHKYMHHKKYKKLILDKVIDYISNYETKKGII
jgi:hypothetical protein